MVFVKFHNMKQKKKFLMSLLNSNKFKHFHFTTSQNNITITVHKCSVFFFSFFNLCTVYFTKKMSVLSFFSFFLLYAVFSNVQVSFPFFSLSFFHCPVPFFFLFFFFLFSFFFSFFHNKLLIHCPFFFNLISTSLCLYLNTITIGSLPSLFNFCLYFRKIKTFLNSLRILFFFFLAQNILVFLNNTKLL